MLLSILLLLLEPLILLLWFQCLITLPIATVAGAACSVAVVSEPHSTPIAAVVSGSAFVLLLFFSVPHSTPIAAVVAGSTFVLLLLFQCGDVDCFIYFH